MPNYLFRLWAHDAPDGLLPEITIRADNKMEAAALALQHFAWIGRPFDVTSYLQCEPADGEHLRVRHVLDWLTTPAGARFATSWALTITDETM